MRLDDSRARLSIRRFAGFMATLSPLKVRGAIHTRSILARGDCIFIVITSLPISGAKTYNKRKAGTIIEIQFSGGRRQEIKAARCSRIPSSGRLLVSRLKFRNKRARARERKFPASCELLPSPARSYAESVTRIPIAKAQSPVR